MVYHKSYKDATLSITDGTPTTTVVDVSNGDLSIKYGQNVEVVFDRGAIHEFKLGDEVPTEFSFSYKLEGIESPTAISAFELFTKTGAASAIAGTRDASTNVHTVDLVWILLDSAGSTEETITLDDCAFTNIETGEGMPAGMIKISGISFSTMPTIT